MAKHTSVFSGGVTFGGVSIGEATARLGIVIDRGVIPLNQADELFCERRLTGKVVLGRLDEANGQKKLIDDVDHQVQATFDVKGFRCSTDYISTGLTFSLKEIDIAELAKFSKGQGRLVIKEVAEIPEEEKAERRDEHIPGTLRAEGPWRDVSLDTLFDPAKALRKALAAADINTIGELADYSASEKRLTDINGIGESKATEIEDQMVDFFADNPNCDKEELQTA